jgi:hypothetical protein
MPALSIASAPITRMRVRIGSPPSSAIFSLLAVRGYYRRLLLPGQRGGGAGRSKFAAIVF